MNYIYDVILDFQKEYYDFYEWNKNDNIFHMRKIPILKINEKQFNEIKNNVVQFSEATTKLLNYKIAERFKQNNITKMKYTIIISTENQAMGIKINKNGILQLKSSLLPDEQDDVIEIIKSQNETKLEYKIIKINKSNIFKTRFEIENENFIYNELEKIYKQKNIQKLKYIYLECFNKQESNIDLAYKKLKSEISKTNENFKKIYNIFKMTKQK